MSMSASIQVAAQVFSALSGFFFMVLPLLLVASLLYYKKKLKLYPIAAIIIERRDNNLIMRTDRIGRVREFGIWKYRFRKAKETIPNPDYNWIVNGTYTPTNFFEKIAFKFDTPVGFAYFYKYGSQQYKPVKIKLRDKEGKITGNFKTAFKPIRDAHGNKVFIKQIVQINPFEKMSVPDFEIVDWDNMNFIVQEHENTEARRKKKDDFYKRILIPALIIGAAVVVLIVAMYFSVQLVQFGASHMSGAASATAKEPIKGVNVPVIGGLMPE